MTDQTTPRHPRRTTAIIVGVLVVVIAAVAGIGLLTAGGSPSALGSSTPPLEPSASSTASSTPSVSSTPLNTTTPSPAATASTPQPTRTATISAPATIRKSLVAEVTKMESVQGTASGPGEIAGPSVRFTIRITNGTGKRIDLSNTVVNAYAGKKADPAVQLESPGGKAFPSSVAAGSSATGVFVFNIPTADRGQVEITVDTSVLNPVIAFKGAAPGR